jgi:hypothetical protein
VMRKSSGFKVQRGSNEVECVWNQDITAQVDLNVMLWTFD